MGIQGGKHTLAPNFKPKIDELKSRYAYKPDNKPNVLRTIYMPNFEVDSAKDEIEVLRKEIAGERKYYDDIIKKMQDDKARFEEDQRLQCMTLQQRYQESIEKLHSTEKYNSDIVKDHIELKHFYELEERAKQEENEQVNQENQIHRNNIRSLCGETRQVMSQAKHDYIQNSEEFS
jgi:hypothetical protein